MIFSSAIRYYFSLWVILSGFTACSTEENIPNIELWPVEKIPALNDTLFYKRIHDITFIKDQFLLSSYDHSALLVTDKNWRLNGQIGQFGKGPGEFLGIGKAISYVDTIYAIDDGNRRVNAFTKNGDYLRTFPTPDGHHVFHSFVRNETGEFFFSTPHNEGEGIVAKTDINGRILSHFSSHNKEEETPAASHLVMNDQGEILMVFAPHPLIRKYNTKGDLLAEWHLDGYAFLQSMLQKIEKMHFPNKNSYYNLFCDAYLYQGKLYVLMADIDGEREARPYKVLIMQEDGAGNLNMELMLELKNEPYPFYETFCVYGENQLLAFDLLSTELHRFEW